MIEQAKEQADRLESANKEHKELLDRQEAMQVENTLAGTADAGKETKEEKSKEELQIEEAKKMIEGSGMEDAIDGTKGMQINIK